MLAAFGGDDEISSKWVEDLEGKGERVSELRNQGLKKVGGGGGFGVCVGEFIEQDALDGRKLEPENIEEGERK